MIAQLAKKVERFGLVPPHSDLQESLADEILDLNDQIETAEDAIDRADEEAQKAIRIRRRAMKSWIVLQVKSVKRALDAEPGQQDRRPLKERK